MLYLKKFMKIPKSSWNMNFVHDLAILIMSTLIMILIEEQTTPTSFAELSEFVSLRYVCIM